MKVSSSFFPAAFLLLFLFQAGTVSADTETLPDTTSINQLIDSANGIGDADLATCLALLDSTLLMSYQIDFERGRLKSLSLLGRYLAANGMYDRAIDSLNKAMTIAEARGYRQSKAILQTRLAGCYQPQGDYQQALELFLDAKETFTELNHVNGLGTCANNLAIIYGRMRDTVAALAYYREASRWSDLANRPKGKINNLINISFIYSEQKQFDSAMHYIAMAENTIRERGVELADGYMHNARGLMEKKRGNLAQAKKEFKAALTFFQRFKMPFRIAAGHVNLGEIYLKQNKASQATSHFQKGLKIAQQIEAIEIEKTSRFLLSNSYDQMGQHRKALKALQAYQEIQQQKITPQVNTELERLRNRYTLERKDKELAQLTLGLEQERIAVARQALNLERQELELSRGRLRLWLSLGGLLVLGIFAGFIAIKYRDNRRHSQLLSEKQALTAHALAEKEVLLGEIHHRVKNNLQLVYNMLDLQSRHLQDESGKKAIQDSMGRVSSMAMIHQKLYQQDNVSGVHMPPYLDQLLSSLYLSFASDTQEIDVQQNVDDLLLDINTAIPIGLIINELVTNAFKYAFQEGQPGQLKVQLCLQDDHLLLEVQDNGPGMGNSSNRADSFGLRLVRSLARQLKAQFSIQTIRGTLVRLEIQKFNRIHP